MRKLTARTIPSGGKYYNERLGHLVRVRDSHTGLYCEACHWDTAIPNRMGLDRIESIRKQHLGVVHFDEILAGRIQISEESLEWTLSGQLPSFLPLESSSTS